MKKLAIAVTGALALAGIGVGISSAVTPAITIKASVSPKQHGTKKKPKVTKLVVKLATTPNPAEPAFAASDTIVHLGKQLTFQGKALKSCSATQVQADDTKCPKGSKVGTGVAAGNALGLTENLTVTAYNGPGGNKLELLVDGQSPLQIHSVIEGILSSDSGLYGKKLTVHVPEALQQPAPGVYATLIQFDTTINRVLGSKKRPYVGINSCPKNKKIAFGVDYKYTDGTSQNAKTTASCS
jgi:hypothetical protein